MLFLTDMILTCSRQEFLPGESSEPGISYHRKGGVFVSKCGVATILIVFLALIAAVGILVYFFAPCKDEVNTYIIFCTVLILHSKTYKISIFQLCFRKK